MASVDGNVVRLNPDDVIEAAHLAEATLEHWKSTGRPGYYLNSFNSHFVGKLGEFAVEALTGAQGTWVASGFRDVTDLSVADVTTNTRHLEVKSWDTTGWEAWGRCVRPTQVAGIEAKADDVVWCEVDGAKEEPGSVPVTVVVHGWSTVDEVKACPIELTGPSYRQYENHQAAVEDLRPIEAL